MFYIQNKYKNDGYATWVKILRLLAVTNYHHLDLSDKSERMYLSSKCGVDELVLTDIICDLSNLGEFDAHLWEQHSIVWSQKFVDSIGDAYKKRNNRCITYQGLLSRLGLKSPVNPESSRVNPQSKEEKSKEKETKKEESKGISPEAETVYFSLKEFFDPKYWPDDDVKNNTKCIKIKNEIKKMHEIDKYPYSTIEAVIKWARKDDFWAPNFLSIKKCRRTDPDGIKYFDRFLESMKKAKKFKEYTYDEMINLKEYQGKWFEYFSRVDTGNDTEIVWMKDEDIKLNSLKAFPKNTKV